MSRQSLHLRLFSAALLPALMTSCQKETSLDADLLRQAREASESTGILNQENKETREKMSALSTRLQELEFQNRKQKESRQDIVDRLKELEEDQLLIPEVAAPPAVVEETPASSDTETPAAAAESPAKPAVVASIPSSITDKVVVIEGDLGRGTGFLCSTEGSLWLYTSAHAISGNKSVTVRDQQNNRYQTFDSMEVAEGVDLVRLKIQNSDAKGLELQTPEQSAEIGEPIAAIGNSDGTGVIVAENGEIRGKGPDSWEISTQIVPAYSGGPVISRKDMKVVGIVTHILLGKQEAWAANTRFTEVRRFAARLDRTYKWTTITPARFLREYQVIAEMDEESRLASAVMFIQMGYGRPLPPRINRVPGAPLSPEDRAKMVEYQQAVTNTKQEAQALVDKNPTHPFVIALKSAQSRDPKYSPKDNIHEFCQKIVAQLDAGHNAIKPEAFTWYHRESYKQSLAWRSDLIEKLHSR